MAAFERLLPRAQLIVEHFGVVNCWLGAAIGRQMTTFQEAAADLTWAARAGTGTTPSMARRQKGNRAIMGTHVRATLTCRALLFHAGS